MRTRRHDGRLEQARAGRHEFCDQQTNGKSRNPLAISCPLPAGDRAEDERDELFDAATSHLHRKMTERPLDPSQSGPSAHRRRKTGEHICTEGVPSQVSHEAPIPTARLSDDLDERHNEHFDQGRQIILPPAPVDLSNKPARRSLTRLMRASYTAAIKPARSPK